MEPSSRTTIRDVAARAGVSVATVSKVINRRYGVAAGTSARVQAVIDDLGYEASLVAQSLRNHRTNVIGILVADLEPFSTELLKGAANDMSAIATIQAATELGLSVPADLFVVGFDNIPESALSTPALTTVAQPIRQMGEQSIHLLIQLIRGEAPETTHLTLATSLVIRHSSRAR